MPGVLMQGKKRHADAADFSADRRRSEPDPGRHAAGIWFHNSAGVDGGRVVPDNDRGMGRRTSRTRSAVNGYLGPTRQLSESGPPYRSLPMFPLALLLLAPAADPAKPEAAKPAEVKLFDGESTFGWETKGDVTVKDGKLVFGKGATATFKCPLPAGSVLIRDGGKMAFDHAGALTLPLEGESTTPCVYSAVTFTPSGLKPIFNGKDLTGWSILKDEKRMLSTAEVTKDGELRLTNGPGDLQSDGKYADFVLQLECKTNGDGLNSGVFFRCLAGQYQNGYEMQIQNGMKDNDPTKPADFGTGAIYRRIAARKIVAKDKEWMTLTLVAKGPTFATWVNGEPVMVWTDDRAKDENPRKGLRLEAGHLSLQGHDKTTDLLFRNIRIAEIK
jgi:hypothetical protein